jgi:hypothetical protein
MWYPAKAAFRAGRVGRKKDGTQWDAAKVGDHSVAFGVDTKASGFAATAMGDRTTASEIGATAMGRLTTASGPDATAMGFKTTAGGSDATAMGFNTTAATDESISLGEYNSANTSADGTLLVAGNGSISDNSDALVLKKDGDLALGPSDPKDLRLHVAKDKPNAGVGDSPGANMVLFENTNTGTKPDVLGLQAGPTNPGSGVTYVSFYQRDGTTIGSIEGNGSGGVNYATSGSDYAEELPVMDGAPAPAPTDLVGVRGGEVHLSTERADRVMIASDRPAVTGNTTPSTETDDARRVAVAFVGQVPAKVRGPVEVGDLIAARHEPCRRARTAAPSTARSPDRRGRPNPATASAPSPSRSVWAAAGPSPSGSRSSSKQTRRSRPRSRI